MAGADFEWAAELMEQRRSRYAALSPVFWRPARDARGPHARFLAAVAAGDGAVALRTDGGFIVATRSGDRLDVDDFAVTQDDRWLLDGRALLLAAWRHATEERQVRVVTARQDLPKRDMLTDAGLTVTERWWVKALTPTGAAPSLGPVDLGDAEGVLVSAPPVYDPGGPVCLLPPHASDDVGVAQRLADAAAGHGAVLAVVQRKAAPWEAPDGDQRLAAAGFHDPSEFYAGVPV